jgi:hypothetical protein
MLQISLVFVCLCQIIRRLAAVSYRETRRGAGHRVIINNDDNNNNNIDRFLEFVFRVLYYYLVVCEE